MHTNVKLSHAQYHKGKQYIQKREKKIHFIVTINRLKKEMKEDEDEDEEEEEEEEEDEEKKKEEEEEEKKTF